MSRVHEEVVRCGGCVIQAAPRKELSPKDQGHQWANCTLTMQVQAPLAVLCPASGHIDFFLDITVNDGQITGQNFAVTGCGQPPPPPGCCPPPNPFFGLGAAGQFSVLGLSGAYVVISEGGTLISGNVGLGPKNTGSLLKATITGTLSLDPSASVRMLITAVATMTSTRVMPPAASLIDVTLHSMLGDKAGHLPLAGAGAG